MTFSAKEREQIIERDGHRCRAFWVAVDIPCADTLEVDHIIPKGRGGLDELSNGWALCTYCHKLKHAYPEAATYLGLYGRETFNKRHDTIDPELFGRYMLKLRQAKKTLAHGRYNAGQSTW